MEMDNPNDMDVFTIQPSVHTVHPQTRVFSVNVMNDLCHMKSGRLALIRTQEKLHFGGSCPQSAMNKMLTKKHVFLN